MIKLLASFLMLMMFLGCSHGIMRGTVAMKISNSEGHVCLGHGEVSKGDHVTIYKQICQAPAYSKASSGGSSCKKVKTGDGEVTEILNEHYSVIKLVNGDPIEEGAIVEKVNK